MSFAQEASDPYGVHGAPAGVVFGVLLAEVIVQFWLRPMSVTLRVTDDSVVIQRCHRSAVRAERRLSRSIDDRFEMVSPPHFLGLQVHPRYGLRFHGESIGLPLLFGGASRVSQLCSEWNEALASTPARSA